MRSVIKKLVLMFNAVQGQPFLRLPTSWYINELLQSVSIYAHSGTHRCCRIWLDHHPTICVMTECVSLCARQYTRILCSPCSAALLYSTEIEHPALICLNPLSVGGEEGAGRHSSEYQLMLSMRVCRQASSQSIQVTWSMWQLTYAQVQGMGV